MKEYSEIGAEELLEWARMNGVNMSEGQAKDVIRNEEDGVDLDKWFEENNIAPIGEYESLSKRMRAKIKEIISSLNGESDDRDEKDTLDEKDGKEELDEDKKEEVEKRKKQIGNEDSPKEEKSEEEEKQNEKEEDTEDKKQETTKKDEYLAMVKKLHEMRIRDYKDQMRKDDVDYDRYFVTMMYLQRNINRQRAAYIKEYGAEELVALENQYLREELKYEKTLNIRMDRDLAKLRALDEKLDSILDRVEELQKHMEDGSISAQEYNEQIDVLEQDKLDTLWKINKLNPELLEEKQENIELRDAHERRVAPQTIAKKKDITAENKAKEAYIKYEEKKQEGMAEEIHEDMQDVVKRDIDEKEKRLDELRKHLKEIDITTVEGKKEALDTIGEIQSLESQKMSQEKQLNNLEKNMRADVQSYADLKDTEQDRSDSVEEFERNTDEIKPEEISDDLMSQLRSQALEDPSTPEQAEEYLDNINEISEEAELKQEEKENKEQENDGPDAPSLWNRRKRPF